MLFILMESSTRVVARESGRPSSPAGAAGYWIPAFAGMTRKIGERHAGSISAERALEKFNGFGGPNLAYVAALPATKRPLDR
jgi:hypothetical protein